jgi:hypothetical protein
MATGEPLSSSMILNCRGLGSEQSWIIEARGLSEPEALITDRGQPNCLAA